MLDNQILKKACNEGLPALKQCFEKLPKEDALKGIGVLMAMGVCIKTLNIIKDIVLNKKD